MRCLLVLSVCLPSLLLAGCGSGGGGGQSNAPFGPELVQGSYRFVSLENRSSNDRAATATGTMTRMGDGLQLSNVWRAHDGVVTPPDGVTVQLPFSVEANRRFALGFVEGYAGRITVDGMLATAVSTTNLHNSSIMILIRQQANPQLVSLAGDWQFLAYGLANDPSYTTINIVGDATINAAGLVSYDNVTFNLDGDINPLLQVALDEQLALEPDGQLALNSAGTITMRGGVSEDGNVILMAGNLNNGVPRIWVLVRKGTAVPTDFAGQYHLTAVDFSAETPVAQWGSLSRPVGTGDIAIEQFYRVANGVQGPVSRSFASGVLGDGQLTLVGPQPQFSYIFRGAVAAGGAYAFMAGGITDQSSRTFSVFVR